MVGIVKCDQPSKTAAIGKHKCLKHVVHRQYICRMTNQNIPAKQGKAIKVINSDFPGGL